MSNSRSGSHSRTGTPSRQYSGILADGSASQHNGDVFTNINHTYALRPRRSSSLSGKPVEPKLIKAAGEGQRSRVAFLSQLDDIDVDYQDDDGLTALHHAVLSQSEATVQVLIDAGADVNEFSDKVGTPLCLASLLGLNNVVDILLESGSSVTASGGLLGSALHCACKSGDVSLVELFIKRNADPNRLSQIQGPPSISLHSKSVPSLLAQDHEDSRTEGLETVCIGPLHVAVWNDNLEIAALLIRSGADVNLQASRAQIVQTGDKDIGFSSLLVAAACESTEAISLLLDHNADIIRGTTVGDMTPLMFAVESVSTAVPSLLISHGVEVNKQDDSGRTALLLASKAGRAACVTLLLGAGADANMKDEDGSTALSAAIDNDNAKTVAVLLDAGAKLESLQEDKCLSPNGWPVFPIQGGVAQELAKRGVMFSTRADWYTTIRLFNMRTFEFRSFSITDSGIRAPQFVILSHAFNSGELSYSQLQGTPVIERRLTQTFDESNRSSHEWLISLCEQSGENEDDIEWLWTEALCIDRDNSVELSWSMQSLRNWYDNAERCIVYLDKVAAYSNTPVRCHDLRRCAWFSDSWSLQTLLLQSAKRTVFSDPEWDAVGEVSELSSELSEVMGIKEEHLLDYTKSCIATRLSWATKLSGRRPEDRIYAMVGILGVSMSFDYGEGEHRAWQRLQKALIEHNCDESLFAWTNTNSVTSIHTGLLAPSIDCFRKCGELDAVVTSLPSRFRYVDGLSPMDGSVKVTMFPSVLEQIKGKTILTLRCEKRTEDSVEYPAIMLKRDHLGIWHRVELILLKTKQDTEGLTSVLVPNGEY